MTEKTDTERRERKRINVQTAISAMFSSMHRLTKDDLLELEDYYLTHDPVFSTQLQKIRELREIRQVV